jgi:hypothetical protein
MMMRGDRTATGVLEMMRQQSKADWFKAKDWSAPKRPPRKPRVPFRTPKEYIAIYVRQFVHSSWFITTDEGVEPWTMEDLLCKFKSLGGITFQDFDNLAYIFVDDFIPNDKLEAASDLLAGYPQILVNAANVRSKICRHEGTFY